MRLVHRIWASCSLFVYFMYELIVSSIRVAWDVLTPTSYARPGFISVPMAAKSDAELMLTANLVSLTPGTLSVDFNESNSHLLVHAMFGAADPEGEVRALKQGIERRVLKATR